VAVVPNAVGLPGPQRQSIRGSQHHPVCNPMSEHGTFHVQSLCRVRLWRRQSGTIPSSRSGLGRHPEYNAFLRLRSRTSTRRRLTMPKFIVNAAGDQSFCRIRRILFSRPAGREISAVRSNADHSLKGSDAYETLLACYNAVLNKLPLPRFSWTLEKDGSIHVRQRTRHCCKALAGDNPDARDFRRKRSTQVRKHRSDRSGRRGLRWKVNEPSKGWTAFFVELTSPAAVPPLSNSQLK